MVMKTSALLILLACSLTHGVVARAQTPPTITFITNAYFVYLTPASGSGTTTNDAYIRVWRLGDTNGTVSVRYTTSDGTAR